MTSIPLRALSWLRRMGPGLALCVFLAATAGGLQALELRFLGRAWLEPIVLAILLGAAVRTVWSPDAVWSPGVGFSARVVLEIAVVLLGATVSAGALAAAGVRLLLAIVVVVALAVAGGYAIGRLLRLPHRMALLIACGNAICGNTAIAAVAPAIGADGDEVAAAIAFTAVLGVAVVLGLPPMAAGLGLEPREFGVFAGLTVYAAPQVLAATAPTSWLAAQVGMVVKLARVLMLAPMVAVLSRLERAPADARGAPSVRAAAPWFVLAFLVLLGARSLGLVPAFMVQPASRATEALTVVSMAALGLGVDVRVVAGAGPRAALAVVLSLAMLGAMALAVVRLGSFG